MSDTPVFYVAKAKIKRGSELHRRFLKLCQHREDNQTSVIKALIREECDRKNIQA